MKNLSFLTLAVAALACEPPPEATASGIYSYSSKREIDTCFPSGVEEVGVTDVSRIGTAIVTHLPAYTSPFPSSYRFELPLEGFHATAALSGIGAANCGSAVLKVGAAVVTYGNPLTVYFRQEFLEVIRPPEPADVACVWLDRPKEDCRSEHTFTLSLIQACEAPCWLANLPGPSCVCPDAGT